MRDMMWKWLLVIFSPESLGRRQLARGLQRESLPVWGAATFLLLLYVTLLAGGTFNLFLPADDVWAWQEVTFPLLGPVVGLGGFLVASALCLFPRATIYVSALMFGIYFLYGAANDAPVDFLLGFAEPLGMALGLVLPASAIRAMSFLWDSVHFPVVKFYAFHFYLPIYVFFTAILAFVYYPARKNSPRDRPSNVDLALCIVTLVFTIEYIVNFGDRGDRAGSIQWPDVVMGTLAVLVSIEMCRRILGWILPILGIMFFLYDMYGNYFPERIMHKGFSYNEVVTFTYSNDGIFGVIANVYASYVFLFILFGVILEMTKVGDVFVNLAFSLVGRLRGGPAKAAVVSSGLVGTVVGSGAANIVITGTFTIPLMKRIGFPAHYAGAVEAVASLGGQLMPPVMGSAAFLVAAFTETSYNYIALISFVPALMYYYAVYSSVHNQSGKLGIFGMAEKDIPNLWELMKKEGYLLIPIPVLIFRLVIGRSPFDAALWAICTAIFLSFFRKDTRLVALPPAIARWLGRPDWGTDHDWMEVRADQASLSTIRSGGTKEEGQAAREKVFAAGVGAQWGILRENWMIWIAAALFVVLMALQLPFGHVLFWSLAAMFLFASPKVMAGLESAAINSLTIGVTAGVMGLILAGVSLPGLALKFSSVVLGYSSLLVDWFGWQGTELPMVIIMSGVASYILGMGMTITAAYVFLSILVVPALVKLGVPELNAHLIVLWQCQYASLTPPFALGAFVAAGIAGADPMRTGFSSLRMAYPLYAVPFLMAYSPLLMDPGSSWAEVAMVWITGFMGLYSFSAGLEGFLRRNLSWTERVNFMAAGVLLYVHHLGLNVIGAVMMGVGIFFHFKSGKLLEKAPIPAQLPK
ncbi:MAG: TRAP transporter fused permease subunit [Candidatus Tectomicrobia bacterium]|uniref:TRAP transporter fused permease subunit n=1 Tax=Tectimicrobiota bacterium TaxID=2528274 RepID=A0A932MS24_UNCTE|nr:TRAP transporter fused permease subunit [Candidatus Tectomicrobia bacterium]